MEPITIYGADWCGDCFRAKRLFERTGTEFEWIDIDADAVAKAKAIRLSGRKNIPVIVFPEGEVLVEPTDPELEQAILRRSA